MTYLLGRDSAHAFASAFIASSFCPNSDAASFGIRLFVTSSCLKSASSFVMSASSAMVTRFIRYSGIPSFLASAAMVALRSVLLRSAFIAAFSSFNACSCLSCSALYALNHSGSSSPVVSAFDVPAAAGCAAGFPFCALRVTSACMSFAYSANESAVFSSSSSGVSSVKPSPTDVAKSSMAFSDNPKSLHLACSTVKSFLFIVDLPFRFRCSKVKLFPSKKPNKHPKKLSVSMTKLLYNRNKHTSVCGFVYYYVPRYNKLFHISYR